MLHSQVPVVIHVVQFFLFFFDCVFQYIYLVHEVVVFVLEFFELGFELGEIDLGVEAEGLFSFAFLDDE